MPAPASEDDLKRRARRRLIGAVALTLVAVIVLPLMLEDKPPPAAQLEVHMPTNKTPDFVPIAPAPVTATTPVTPASPSGTVSHGPPEPAAKVSAEEVAGEKPQPNVAPEVKKSSKPPPSPPLKAESKTTVEKSSAFVVQLGAFSDASKTEDLKLAVDQLGMSSYTDKSGELTRLRVGPFTSREAATAAAAKLGAAGVHGQVMPK